jgi:hypothetical protein
MSIPTPTPRVTVDSSDISHVVFCRYCMQAWIFMDLERAQAHARNHRTMEQTKDRVDCNECDEPATVGMLCRKHYQRAYRAARKALA